MKISKNHSGFTMAEILITLAIIGVVAALTVPTLINNYRERALITGLKKFYSVLSQAYQMAVIDYGNPEIWDLQRYKDETQDKPGSAGSADELMQRFAKYINITKFCKAADKNCMKEINYKYLNGKDDKQQWRGGRFSTVILNDGSILYNYVHTTNCSADIDASKNLKDCASFYVDLNGYKGPNQRGIDMFEFALTNQGFIPKGDPVKGKPIHSFDSTCSNKNTQGFGCTAWVLRFDNMDYLKCDDLSWNGKHSCSD